MITSFQIYLLTLLDGVRIFSAVTFSALIVIIIISTGLYIDAKQKNEPWRDPERFAETEKGLKIARNWIKRAIIFEVVLLLVLLFLPGTKEAAFIYLTPRVVNNEQMQKLPENTLKFLNKKMENYITSALSEEE